MSGRVHVERDAAGVVTLRLDNPAHRNALNNGMIAAMTDAFRVLAGDAACRVVVLRGAGGTFCAGREITDLQTLQASGLDAILTANAKLRYA